MTSLVAVLLTPFALSCANRPPAQAPQQSQLTSAVSAPDRLTAPEDLSGPARAILRTRMASHVRDMGDLMSAVMILKYDLIEKRADTIANDVSLARPLTGDATELNSALPEKFFGYQDELRAAAIALKVAAADEKAFRVADAYGRLSETCVKCHATYREGVHAAKAP